MAKRGRRPKITQGIPLEESVDDLNNLSEPSPAGKYQRCINKLKKNGFVKISQIKCMCESYGEESTLEKLQQIDRIGEELSIWVVMKALDYKYPNGFVPGITEEEMAVMLMDNKDTAKQEEVVESKKETNVAKAITMDEIDTISININDYASNLVEESQLPGILLNIVFDLFEDEKYTPERIHFNNSSYEQQDLYYNNTVVLIHKEFLMKVFAEKCRNLKTINNLDIYNMFHVAVKKLNCVYNYTTKKDGHRYYWGRKPNLLGANPLNYIEIYRMDAEAMLNRKFNIPSDEEISQIMSELGFNTVEEETKSISSRFYILPEACNYENGKYIFKFNIAEIRDKFDFNMKDINWKSGTYVFSKANVNNGELLLTRGFTDKDYDEILILVGEFLTK